jgi:hypothetical protein
MGFRTCGTRLEIQNRGHSCQEHRVDPVGLGQFTCRFGKATGIARVHLDDGYSGLGQGLFQKAMIWASGLENDPDGRLADPTDQRGTAGLVVRELTMFASCRPKAVQNRFRDVDADDILHCLYPLPRLVIRAVNPGIRSGQKMKTGAIPLQHGTKGDPASFDPTPATARHKWRGGQWLPFASGAAKRHKTSASFHSFERIAPSNHGIKHLGRGGTAHVRHRTPVILAGQPRSQAARLRTVSLAQVVHAEQLDQAVFAT